MSIARSVLTQNSDNCHIFISG